ncbi:RapZ C-terminal domain-containing protein [Streptomyces mordarskii]|uniref:RapZ C-terminal domain-containing protein n=1 Tax=Streptomyces mordarskii TaxID=1226758 RepID=A0ABN1EUG2_9ACTN
METTPQDLSSLYDDRHVQSVITSYGDGHHDAPRGTALLVDTRILRNPPEDPEVRQRMLHSSGLDPEVRQYVMATPGARRLVEQNAEKVRILLEAGALRRWAGPQLYRVDVHVVCGGGRHRVVDRTKEF